MACVAHIKEIESKSPSHRKQPYRVVLVSLDEWDRASGLAHLAYLRGPPLPFALILSGT